MGFIRNFMHRYPFLSLAFALLLLYYAVVIVLLYSVELTLPSIQGVNHAYQRKHSP